MKTYKRALSRLLPILVILGPGIISGSVDNDAGGITTYSLAGAQFGLKLIWILFLTTFCLDITQAVGARMGLVTGKGLGALIREKYAVKWAVFTMAVLLLANVGVAASEFAGIASALQIFHVSKFISVPLFAIIVYLFVIKGSFKKLEQFFLLASAFYLVYIVSAVLAHPNWTEAVKSLVIPTLSFKKDFIITAIAVIGTTITPWGQFFIQDYVVDKKLGKEDIHVERLDVFLGSWLTNFIAFFIMVACAATIFIYGQTINDAGDAAKALQPLAGQFASLLFAFGFLNAGIFGAALVPVSTSYVICNTLGFEHGLNFHFKEAPQFYGIFAFIIFVGALLTILPFIPLLTILFWAQVINAILLLPILVFVFLLSNDKKLLGKYCNGKIFNAVIIATFLIIAASTIAYIVSQFIG
ncbi:MAG TPA: divalent metal cation transporter [Patescibacteria group bacterium]|nr:divalent metal cation transporter [Patescibacteria group bacterium]